MSVTIWLLQICCEEKVKFWKKMKWQARAHNSLVTSLAKIHKSEMV